MDESELMESLSFLPSSSLLFCDREGLGGRCGTPPESPTALGRLRWTRTWWKCTRWCLRQDLAGRGGRPELSGVRPEDSLLKKKLTYWKRFELLKNLIWKDAEVEGDSSVVVRRQLVRRGSSPYKYKWVTFGRRLTRAWGRTLKQGFRRRDISKKYERLFTGEWKSICEEGLAVSPS